jgi:hypothetical protein
MCSLKRLHDADLKLSLILCLTLSPLCCIVWMWAAQSGSQGRHHDDHYAAQEHRITERLGND